MRSIDAVVVAYNSAERLGSLLPLLRAEEVISSVVVVDHGGDNSAAVAHDHGATVLINPLNPGFGAGQNSGVAKTSAPLVLLVNPDLEPAAGTLDAAARFLEENPTAAAVQGVIRSEVDGQPERSAGRSLGAIHLWGRVLRLRPLLSVSLVRRVARRLGFLEDHVERVPASPTVVQSLAATMVLVRRVAFESVGGFDEDFFLYGEDLDLCARLRNAGWELWALPETWATHASGESSSDRWARELVWWEGTMRFAALHWRAAQFGSGLGASILRATTLCVRRPAAAEEVFARLVLKPIRTRAQRR